MTVHAPQPPWPQPSLVPVRPISIQPKKEKLQRNHQNGTERDHRNPDQLSEQKQKLQIPEQLDRGYRLRSVVSSDDKEKTYPFKIMDPTT